MTLQQDKIWPIGKWLLFLCSLQSFGAWFFWKIPEVYGLFFTFIASLTLIGGRTLSKSKNTNWFIIYAIAFLLTIFTQSLPNLNGLIAIFLKLFPLFLIFSLKEEYKHDLYVTFRKGLGVIFAVSVFFWVLYLIGISTPFSVVEYGSLDEGGYQYSYENHYLYLVNITSLYSLFPRFSCIFLEPGYTGCLLTVLLLSGRFKMNRANWENVVFLLSLVLTFSLAGWFLAVLSYFLLRLEDSQRKLLWLTGTLLGFGLFYYVVSVWNGGDNIVNMLIFNRLEFDSSTGIVGNHRFSESLNYEFWNHFIRSDRLLFGGVSAANYTDMYHASNEVTIVAYIMQYGLIATLFLVWYFFYPPLSKKRNRYAQFILSLIFFLIFAQTIHMTHSLMYIVLMVICSNEIMLWNKNNI